MLFEGLILLSAAGIKIREGKHAAAGHHTGRAAALLRRLMNVPDRAFERALGMSPATLAEYAEVATRRPADLQETCLDSRNPCSISFSDQFPTGGGADRKRETVLDRLGSEWEKAVRELHSSGWRR